MKKDRRIDQELKAHRTLAPAEVEADRKYAQRSLVTALKEANCDSALGRIIDVARTSSFLGGRAIAHGDPNGWVDILKYCDVSIAANAAIGVRSSYTAWELAGPILLCFAYEGWSPRLKRIQKSVDHLLETIHANEREEVTLAYFASFIGQVASGNAKPSGPNGPLFKLAQGAFGRLDEELVAPVCEYQLSNMAATEDDGEHFVNFELIPVWHFALARARAGKGLETPVPNHPLFETQSATLPAGLQYDPGSNAMLACVDAVVNRDLDAAISLASEKSAPAKKAAKKGAGGKPAKKSTPKKAAVKKAGASKAAKKKKG